jgi:spermidine/putrescine transport system substrate-binding protein
MKPRELAQQFKAGRLSRRQMLQALGSVGIVATTFPVFMRPARADDINLTVFTWSEYDGDAYHQKFIDKHGGSPKFSIFGESEEALQKLLGGFHADVVHPCTADIGRWKDAGVIKPLDVSRLEQWENVFPSLKGIKGIQIDGAYYHMPWDWGNESIIYRTDKVDIKEESLTLMVDDRYKGQMAMYDSVDSMTGLGGKLAGVANPFDPSDAEIEQIFATWKKIQANMKFYWTDSSQVEQAIAAGELVASWAWNEAVLNLSKQGIPVKYMKPKEGIFTWVCGLALGKEGEGSEDQAYDFLNSMLDPDSGKALIENFGYGHSNRKSFDLVDPEQVKAMGLADLDGMLATTNFYDPIPPEPREKLVALFDQVKAGI